MSTDFMNALNKFARELERKFVQREDIEIVLKPHAYENLVKHLRNDPDYMRMIENAHIQGEELKIIGIKFMEKTD